MPNVADPVLAPFWEATQRHALVVRRCDDCRRLQWPPKPRCAGCTGARFSWVETEPRGTLHSHFTAMRSFHPGFVADTPYTVGLVELTCGLRMLGRVLDIEHVRIGLPVEAVFAATPGAATLVHWTIRGGTR